MVLREPDYFITDEGIPHILDTKRSRQKTSKDMENTKRLQERQNFISKASKDSQNERLKCALKGKTILKQPRTYDSTIFGCHNGSTPSSRKINLPPLPS